MRPSRAVAFVCMVPAAKHLEARPSLAEERCKLVEATCTCTHWPFEPRAIVSQGGAGSVAVLSAEARSLVVGARSAERCKWRAAAIREAALTSWPAS